MRLAVLSGSKGGCCEMPAVRVLHDEALQPHALRPVWWCTAMSIVALGASVLLCSRRVLTVR
jgi:hypothetical protein